MPRTQSNDGYSLHHRQTQDMPTLRPLRQPQGTSLQKVIGFRVRDYGEKKRVHRNTIQKVNHDGESIIQDLRKDEVQGVKKKGIVVHISLIIMEGILEETIRGQGAC